MRLLPLHILLVALLLLPACSEGSIIPSDSPALCGNGVLEPGEICDGNCATSCNDGDPCTADGLVGSAESCDAVCSHTPIEDCGDNCGNSDCEPDESCSTCSEDCGECPSCEDGIQNQGEAGTDCGGPCPACTPLCASGDESCPDSCSAETDCDCDTDGPRVVGVEASDNDGHLPTNAVDGSLDSRWSAAGLGQWIELELSCPALVDTVAIAFYRGNERQTTISIEISTDGGTWTEALAAVASAGDTLALEPFSFAELPARFVRVIGHGNNSEYSEWISLTEIVVEDYPVDIECIPNSNECGDDGCNGEHPLCASDQHCQDGTCIANVAATYAVIGDSMSNAYGDWPGTFVTLMGLSQDDLPLFAVSGNTCAQVYNQLVDSVADGTTNLFCTCGVNGFIGADNPHWYQAIYDMAKEKGIANLYMTTMPPWDRINELSQTTADQYCDKMQTENNWLKEFDALHTDLHVVNLWSIWHGTSGRTVCGWRTDQTLTSDGVHPNATGSSQWATAYYELFAP